MAEDRKERVDRELIEMLNELRVALPGVQVLFAFLLIVPFQQGFAEVSEVSRLIYFGGLAASAASIAFFIAPATYHRLNLRRGTTEKERMLLTSNRLVLIGTALVAAGMTCSVFIVADLLFGIFEATVAAVLTAVLFSLLWYGLPLSMRRAGKDPAEDPGEDPEGGP